MRGTPVALLAQHILASSKETSAPPAPPRPASPAAARVAQDSRCVQLNAESLGQLRLAEGLVVWWWWCGGMHARGSQAGSGSLTSQQQPCGTHPFVGQQQDLALGPFTP